MTTAIASLGSRPPSKSSSISARASFGAFRLAGFCVFAVVLVSVCATAQQAPPSADTFVSSAAPTMNYGAMGTITVGNGVTGYIKFNLAPLSTGASVSKATLRLYVSSVTKAGSFDVYELDGPWSESTLKFNSPPPPLGVSATGNQPIAISTSSNQQFVVIDITPLVQNWVNGSVANQGVALSATSALASFSFDSKEAKNTSHQPVLEIVTNGAVGPQGPKGDIGPAGTQGPSGMAGPAGMNGVVGPQGPKGDTGQTGPQGFTGPVGPNGSQGLTGPQGSSGPLGPAGMNGAVGPQGVQGPKGDTGQTGPQGASGTVGPTGPFGLQGPKGDTGPMGVQGPIGPQGPAGMTAQAVVVSGSTGVVGGGLYVAPSIFLNLAAGSWAISANLNFAVSDVVDTVIPPLTCQFFDNNNGIPVPDTDVTVVFPSLPPGGSLNVTMPINATITSNTNLGGLSIDCTVAPGYTLPSTLSISARERIVAISVTPLL